VAYRHSDKKLQFKSRTKEFFLIFTSVHWRLKGYFKDIFHAGIGDENVAEIYQRVKSGKRIVMRFFKFYTSYFQDQGIYFFDFYYYFKVHEVKVKKNY